jgi:hypothetical protein
MAMYSFVPPFREAKFCGVPTCVFDKSGCAAGEKSLRNTSLDDMKLNYYPNLGKTTIIPFTRKTNDIYFN